MRNTVEGLNGAGGAVYVNGNGNGNGNGMTNGNGALSHRQKMNRKASSPMAPAFMVSAPGKVIVCGEHAVVHGKAAIAAAISMRSYLLVTSLSKSRRTVSLRFPDIDLEHTWNIDDLPWPLFHSPEKKKFYYSLVTDLDHELVEAMQPHLVGISPDKPEELRKVHQNAASGFLYLFLLAALHQYDDSLPDRIDGEMRVPMSIEREVAILKLVDHPNVMKVYDIWENRSEIYLVLEYVDKGDLFDYINTNGRLNEEAAMYLFRQIMSAMQHCHAFNICHRDLKPENILLNADNQIKIADFGMAALHQSEGHRLETACGSPHYAAPELLKNKHYRGDRADVWSMGVILYAILAARLPFDDPDIRVLLARTKKGIYEMPEFLSPEAKDLICRMLQVNPDIRISLKDMWRHPLIRKYDYLDDFGTKAGQPRNIREGFDYTPLKPQEVDDHLVRQLRSLWHMFSEHQIKLMLLDSSKNDQKLFYWLLQQYRQKQLENFLPEVSQSPSDYHHLHQPAWKKRVSTCEFTQPRAHGPGRSISKFTVISNVPDTDVGTVKSYDPYNSSRPMRANSQSIIDYSTEATSPSRHHSGLLSPPQKKKSFGLLFWKSNKAENRMSIAGPDYEDSPSPESRKTGRSKASHHGEQSIAESDSGIRKIEVHQTWLARLFGVKPATSHMCLVVSRKRARQELAILLKDWRRYGIRDIQVDKERNVVFARIGSKNYLNIKEVSFAMEIMTVIEHGKRGSLSIVRFTQERGAASSFQKVVDTIKSVFGSRHLLVTDKRKSKMMIKTLNS
ncbi:serine/threonine-protein kinase HSL1 like [Verticillium longisporum]|nr:serine/threonine-protein kinase HSL1 like [Verticillium longisporum]